MCDTGGQVHPAESFIRCISTRRPLQAEQQARCGRGGSAACSGLDTAGPH